MTSPIRNLAALADALESLGLLAPGATYEEFEAALACAEAEAEAGAELACFGSHAPRRARSERGHETHA